MAIEPEVLVIGGGLAGLTSALAAARTGADVRLASEKQSTLRNASGLVDVLGYTPDGEGPLVDPYAAITPTRTRSCRHTGERSSRPLATRPRRAPASRATTARCCSWGSSRWSTSRPPGPWPTSTPRASPSRSAVSPSRSPGTCAPTRR